MTTNQAQRTIDLRREDVVELLPAYTLGILEQDEMLAIDSFIGNERRFFDQIHQAEEAATLLTRSVQPVSPPASIKRVIMMIARLDAPSEPAPVAPVLPIQIATAQPSTAIQLYGEQKNTNGNNRQSNNLHALVTNNQTVTYAIAPYRPTPPNVKTIRRAPPPGAYPVKAKIAPIQLWAATAMTAFVALLVVAGLMLLTNGELSRVQLALNSSKTSIDTLTATTQLLRNEKAVLAKANTELLGQTDTLQSTMVQQINELNQQLANVQGRLLQITQASKVNLLQPTEGANPLQSTFYVVDQRGLLFAQGLEPLRDGKAYQLWLIDEQGEKLPVAIFTVDPDQPQVWREFPMPAGAPNYRQVGISIEELGGSLQPSAFVLLSPS